MEKVIRLEKSEGIAVVTIDNPPLNVLSEKVVKELSEVFDELEKDQEVIVVILTGAGQKAFMAGADIKEFPLWLGQKDMVHSVRRNHDLLNKIEAFPKPTIAMLNGLVLGGGCELALSCDMRIAEEHVQIGLPEIKLGIFPGGGGTQRLPRLVGTAKAKELMFTGDPISAEEAKSIGLVNRVVVFGSGIEAAFVLAKKIARHSLVALSSIKEAVDYGVESHMEMGINRETDLFYKVFQTEDAREGIEAFIQKRSPRFRHK